MRILCKGFNLYNQLNCPAKCPTVGEFQLTGNCSPGDHFSIAHTYSVLASDTVLKLHCNLAKTQQLDLCNTKISRVTVGDDKLLVLAEDGQLLKVSLKDWSPAPLPKFIGNQDRVKCISSTSKLFMAYSENGLLYTIPEQVDFVNRNIVDMQCGREHCLLLDTDGNVVGTRLLSAKKATFTHGAGTATANWGWPLLRRAKRKLSQLWLHPM
ncbi:hypothetical protein D910_03029 [Dendroctonus ponderosae]|uniref:Uncharacterized protein n=1 Tax=Dendroctonus ponderosae TaxID=77166 RepID=U4U6M9_DENPD|nr:hypothetical protein D910_03029 [Dendroctonus ponderosae]